jgi:hypothetical protein
MSTDLILNQLGGAVLAAAPIFFLQTLDRPDRMLVT